METLPYKLRRYSRAKSLKILLQADGGVTVTAPKFVSQRKIDEFVQSRQAWIARAQAKLRSRPQSFATHGSPAEYQAKKAAALRYVCERLAYFNHTYQLSWTAVAVRNPKSRWGSCSSTGRLMFSYKLVCLPPALADYIIVHELCHRQEMNHSRKFWQLVAVTIPDYAIRRRQLRLGA